MFSQCTTQKENSVSEQSESDCWKHQIMVQGWRNKTRNRLALTLKSTSASQELCIPRFSLIFLPIQQCLHPPKDSQYRSLCSVFIPPSVRAASISVISLLRLTKRKDTSYKHLRYFCLLLVYEYFS